MAAVFCRQQITDNPLHSTNIPPDRGQGLNHCIQDISNLLTAILSLPTVPSSTIPSTESPVTNTQASAISAYDAELVKRGAEEVENSRKNSMLIHDFEKFMNSPVLKQGYARARSAGGQIRSPPPGKVWIAGRDTQCENEVERKVESVGVNGGDRGAEKEKEREEQLELTLMKEYRRKVHEMSTQERLDMQIKLVGEIEGLSRLVAEKSRELREVLKML